MRGPSMPVEKQIRVVGDLTPSDRSTTKPGGIEVALETEAALVGRRRLGIRETTPWHRHEERDTYGAVVQGRLGIEYGPDASTVEVGPGGFFSVPAGITHRESNLGDERVLVLLVLAGEGPQTTAASAPDRTPDVPPRVAAREELSSTVDLANLTRLTPFPDADVQQVYGHSSGRMASEWHHHGDNDVLGYVLQGKGYVDLLGGEDERVLAEAGEFFHIPAGIIHRHVNPVDEEQAYLLWLTGSEPRTVRVDPDEPTPSR